MDKSMTWKVGLIIAVIVLSIWLMWPLDKKLNLGLDLRGGMHLIMEVETDEAIAIQADMSVTQLKGLFKDGSIKYDKIVRKGFDKIEITGTLQDDERKIKDILDDDFRDWTYTVRRQPDSGRAAAQHRAAAARPVGRPGAGDHPQPRRRIRRGRAHHPEGRASAGDKILIELPGIDNPERVKSLIKSTAMLEFRAVVSGPFLTEEAALKDYNGQLPEDLEIVKTNPRRLDKGFYVLSKATVVPGKRPEERPPRPGPIRRPGRRLLLQLPGGRPIRKVHRRQHRQTALHRPRRPHRERGHHPGRHLQRRHHPRPLHRGRGRRHRAGFALRRPAGAAEIHRGTDHRPLAGRRLHPQGAHWPASAA